MKRIGLVLLISVIAGNSLLCQIQFQKYQVYEDWVGNVISLDAGDLDNDNDIFFSWDEELFKFENNGGQQFTSEHIYYYENFTDSIVDIPDPAFLNALISQGFDEDSDNQISFSEAERIHKLFVSEKGIADMTGIEAFINLDTLECQSNNLTELDVSHNTKLKYLYCAWNELAGLDVSENTLLTWLVCRSNALNVLDLSHNTTLEDLNCGNNQLITLDLSANTLLRNLNCNKNLLETLNLCTNDSLTWVDISNMPSLDTLYISDNVTISDEGSIYEKIDCESIVGHLDYYCGSDLSIYPNPTRDILWIETNSSGKYFCDISSLNGQIICSIETEGAAHQIDFSSFPRGIYLITVKSKDFVTTQKVIKL